MWVSVLLAATSVIGLCRLLLVSVCRWVSVVPCVFRPVGEVGVLWFVTVLSLGISMIRVRGVVRVRVWVTVWVLILSLVVRTTLLLASVLVRVVVALVRFTWVGVDRLGDWGTTVPAARGVCVVDAL